MVVPSEVLYFVLPCYVLSLVESLQAELFGTSTECVLLQDPSCYILMYSLVAPFQVAFVVVLLNFASLWLPLAFFC